MSSEALEMALIVLEAECKLSELSYQVDSDVCLVDGVAIYNRLHQSDEECIEETICVVIALRNLRKRKLH